MKAVKAVPSLATDRKVTFPCNANLLRQSITDVNYLLELSVTLNFACRVYLLV
jgi:hypothetical protein